MFEVILNPRQAFINIKSFNFTYTFFSYVSIVVSLVFLMIMYFKFVNFPWLQAHLIGRLDDDQREIAKGVLTPNIFLISSTAGRVVKTTIGFGVLAFIYDVVGRSFRSERSFLEWLQLVVFSNIPLIALLPVGFLAMSLSPVVTLLPNQLDTTSLAFLLSGSEPSPWDGPLAQLSLVQLWIVAIQAVGIGAWLNIGIGRAALIAALPFVLRLVFSAAVALL